MQTDVLILGVFLILGFFITFWVLICKHSFNLLTISDGREADAEVFTECIAVLAKEVRLLKGADDPFAARVQAQRSGGLSSSGSANGVDMKELADLVNRQQAMSNPQVNAKIPKWEPKVVRVTEPADMAGDKEE